MHMLPPTCHSKKTPLGETDPQKGLKAASSSQDAAFSASELADA